MYTSAELTLLRAIDHGARLPGIDTLTGNQDSASSLTQLSHLAQFYPAGVYYDPAANLVRVTQAGAVLNGINFGTATVQIMADDVTIENCTFTGTTGWYSVHQLDGCSGAVIKNSTFNNPGQSLELSAYIGSPDAITIANNTFLNSPGDAVDISAGTVTGNYFSGAGYSSTGEHPDAIWVTASTGPTVISNNFIDWTANATSTNYTNNCIRITTELGNASNITVTGNYLIGGSSVVDAGNAGTGVFSNINISNNYLGFGTYYDIYPGPQKGVTGTGNVIFDYTNPIYSTRAWAAYLAQGIVTDSLVVATATQTSISAAATGSTTLYGNGEGILLYGGAGATIYIGGAGAQRYWGGSGKGIYSYLSVGDSPNTVPDAIGNFHVATDVIDLHAINANLSSAKTVNFTFIGGAAFSTAGGEVRVVQNVASGETYVQADLVGDSSADLQIRIGGLVALTAANFALTTAQYNADISAQTTAVSIASFRASQASLDQVAGGFSIADSAANIQANLAALEADAAHINGVTPTSGAVSVNAATFAADRAILDKVTGGFAVADTGANIQSHLGSLALDFSQITSVTLSDSTASAPGVLAASAADAASDAGILAKIASPYVFDLVGASGTTVTGHGTGLTIAVGDGDTVTGGSNGDTFYLAANFGAARITDFGAYATSAAPDTISLSTRDFANWATLLADGHQSGMISVFTSADGSSLALDGVSLSSLRHASPSLQSEFKFHA